MYSPNVSCLDLLQYACYILSPCIYLSAFFFQHILCGFSGHVQDVKDHLTLYHRLDIALDPFPYAGTTTTCEALLMGVPVVTLTGRVHAHNVGVSLLNSVSVVSHLIANTKEEYIKIASQLASDLPALAALRMKIRPCMLQSSLCDGVTFSNRVNFAFRAVWDHAQTKAPIVRQYRPPSERVVKLLMPAECKDTFFMTQKLIDYVPTTCAVSTCGKIGSTASCGQCKVVWYCSKECQKVDWKQNKHSVNCQHYKLLCHGFVAPPSKDIMFQ